MVTGAFVRPLECSGGRRCATGDGILAAPFEYRGSDSVILFDQYSTSTNLLKNYASTNPVMPEANAQDIWHLLPPTDPVQYAKYLSVKVMGHWHAGSLIYWDRRLCHSSDDFRLNGIKEKSALVLFTSSNE